MSNRRRPRRIRRALVVSLVLFVLGILVGSNCSEGRAEAYPLSTAVEQAAVVQEELDWMPVLNTAETHAEAILTDRATQTRRFLPDGHVEASIRITGLVRAGIAPFHPDSVLMTGSLFEGVTVSLKEPAITESYLDSCLWRFSNDIWAWMPDEVALGLRERMIASSDSVLQQIATHSGLLEMARWNAVETVTRLFSALGVDRVSVEFASGSFESSMTPGMHPNGGDSVSVRPGTVKKVALASLCIGAVLMAVQQFSGGRGRTGISGEASAGASLQAAFVREARAIGLFNAAEYTGSAFVRDSISMKVLGVKIGQASMWVTAPGTVHVAVDLSGLSESDVSANGAGGMQVNLPQPIISGCEIDRSRADVQRPVCVSLCGLTAERLGGLEDSLFVRAQEILVRQALDMGILERARDNTEAALRGLLARVSSELGRSAPTQADVVFADQDVIETATGSLR